MEELLLDFEVLEIAQRPLAICHYCQCDIMRETDLRVVLPNSLKSCRTCAGGNTEYYNGELWDNEWLTIHTFICDRCEDRYDNNDYGGAGMCENCETRTTIENEDYDSDYDEDEEESDEPNHLINPAHANAAHLGFLGSPKDKIYYGVELEVEISDGSSRRTVAENIIQAVNGGAIVKEDGSLICGFEIVTAPSSMEVTKRTMLPLLTGEDKSVRSFAKTNSMKSWFTDTCGMHVHVSRRPLTQLQIGKIQAFIHHSDNFKLIRSVAGRCDERWGDYRKPKKITDKTAISKEHYASTRYTALNLTNAETIEFRIFKGTLKRSGFFRNLEFVHALVNFTKPGVATITDSLSASVFLKWLSAPERKDEYPNLIEFLRKKEYLPPAKKGKPCV